ncbi:MAG: cytochrome c maturation protein CcmE [Polyangiaceae bacterium]
MSKNLDNELEKALADTEGEDLSAAKPVPVEEPRRKPRRKGSMAFLIALLTMAAAVVALFLIGFKEAAIYAMPTDEVVAKSKALEGKRLRVEGELVPGTLVKAETGCEYRFTIQTNGVQLPVRFTKCTIPDTFRDRPEGGVQVTVEGELAKGGGTLEASEVMAKCASKYDPETHEMVMPDGTRVKASAAPAGQNQKR